MVIEAAFGENMPSHVKNLIVHTYYQKNLMVHPFARRLVGTKKFDILPSLRTTSKLWDHRELISYNNAQDRCRYFWSTSRRDTTSPDKKDVANEVATIERKNDVANEAATSEPNDKVEGKLLYQRSTDRYWLPRYLAFFSSATTGYWTWYIYDFLPAVEKTGAFSSNLVGLFGLGSSLFMLGSSYMYPRYLVSEIRLLRSHQVILKTCTNFPFISPEKDGTFFPRGTLSINNMADQAMIVKKGNGSITGYDGHLAIQFPESRFVLLLQPGPGEVKDEAELAKVLLGDRLSRMMHDSIKEEEKNSGGDGGQSISKQRALANRKRHPRPSPKRRK